MLVAGRLHLAGEGGRDSDDDRPAPRRRRGRPRSSGAERAILLAGARLLEERGVRRMSMQAVAAAARVSKATIYRRWPSKDALILDLVAGAAGEPDDDRWNRASGPAGARAELLAWVRAGLEAERSPRGAALQHLLRRAAEDPVLAASLRRRVLERHRDRFVAIVQRGVGAGEIRPDLDVATLLDLVSGPLLYRSLIAAPDPADRDPEEHAQAIVDMLWPGIRAAPRSGLQ
jgi:AcrR family transcriptional regulator